MNDKVEKLNEIWSKITVWWMNNGFWKTLFVIYSLLLCVMNYGGLMSGFNATEFNIAVGWVLTVEFVLVGGYFYALAWNKKFYSLTASKAIIITLITSAVLLCLFSIYVSIPQIMVTLKIKAGENAIDSNIRNFSIAIATIYYLVVYFIINSPVVVAYNKYKKRYLEMQSVKKPYWKLFLTYFACVSILSFYHLIVASDKSQLNGWDAVLILTCIFNALIMILYAFSIKFGKQKFWKISIFPYLLINIGLLFLASEHLLLISRIQLITESFVALIANSLISVGFFYVYYRYAFSKDVYTEAIVENNKEV